MKARIIFLLILGVLLVTGCTGQPSPTGFQPTDASLPTTQPGMTRTATLTQTITSTLTPRPSPSPTNTLTPIPPTATWTPISTINSTESYNLLMSYYENNDGCKLPCWWGIVPGKTTWEEARNILSMMSEERGPYTITKIPSYQYSFDVPINLDPLGLGFFEPRLWVDHDSVYGINLNTGWIQKGVDYSLSSVFKEFGQPNEIWIDLKTDVQDKPHYEIDLFYPYLGLLFNSTGDGEFVDTGVEICPQRFKRGHFPAAVTLFPPRSEISYVELKNLLFDWSANEFSFVRLNSISDRFDETLFYQTYQDPNTSICFHTKK